MTFALHPQWYGIIVLAYVKGCFSSLCSLLQTLRALCHSMGTFVDSKGHRVGKVECATLVPFSPGRDPTLVNPTWVTLRRSLWDRHPQSQSQSSSRSQSQSRRGPATKSAPPPPSLPAPPGDPRGIRGRAYRAPCGSRWCSQGFLVRSLVVKT